MKGTGNHMDMNAISNVTTATSVNTTSVLAKKAAEEAEVAKTPAEETGVIYEKSNENEKVTSAKDNKAIIAKLKADAEERTSQLRSIVEQLITKQGTAFGKATDDEMWKFLAKGEFTVSADVKAQAEADIAEDGYWGVEATSKRIVDFAVALCGDDKDKLEEMKEAFEKGFKQAEKTWGGELPDICQRTYDAVFDKFDNLINPQTETAEVIE